MILDFRGSPNMIFLSLYRFVKIGWPLPFVRTEAIPLKRRSFPSESLPSIFLALIFIVFQTFYNRCQAKFAPISITCMSRLKFQDESTDLRQGSLLPAHPYRIQQSGAPCKRVPRPIRQPFPRGTLPLLSGRIKASCPMPRQENPLLSEMFPAYVIDDGRASYSSIDIVSTYNIKKKIRIVLPTSRAFDS